jgi:uncharacterized membrane protein
MLSISEGVSVFRLISGIFICAGAVIVFSAFVPRLRPHWARTNISCGFLGCLGIGTGIMSSAADHFFSRSVPVRWHDRLVWLFFLGMAVGMVGMILDKRKAKRANMMQGLQTHLVTKKVDQRS